MKLDPERLKGPRGITVIENTFRDFKFHGKGHERVDLNRVMKRLEHWAHRLYPRFQFDDCLDKIEKLGQKKPVQVNMSPLSDGEHSNGFTRCGQGCGGRYRWCEYLPHISSCLWIYALDAVKISHTEVSY
jgi:hypothetical protein